MNKALRKIAALLLILVLFLSGIPSEFKLYAAASDITLTLVYNADTEEYDISFPLAYSPGRVVLTYHAPDGTPVTDEVLNPQLFGGKITISMPMLSDYIYDISVDVYKNIGDPASAHQGKIYYLADITFTGESFNEMAKMSDIEDENPLLIPNSNGKTVTVKSGEDPTIKFKWKIPTFYSTTLGRIATLTVNNNGALNELAEADIPISKVSFHFNMAVGHGSTRFLDFKTDYAPDRTMIIEDKNITVAGIDTNGTVIAPDGFVSVVLKKEQGIEPGTEYEFTNIGVIFENALSEQIPVRRTKLRTDADNRFMVKNIDNAFSEVGYELSSIFTPMQMELSKVDTDKVEVRFKKIVNGVYPELYYQVQHASRIDDFYTQSSRWVKIPASSLPASEDYGSEIVTITIPSPGTSNPEYYFRAVYFDSSSNQPRSSSLCINLKILDIDSGKPPLPREVKAEAIYTGRETVTVPTTEISSGQVEIPGNDLRLSFEKPLIWKQGIWSIIKNQPYTDSDLTFHVILSAYLPDSAIDTQTKAVGVSDTKEVYMPVKQKRVLVLGKKDLSEDPNDSNRLVFTIPGDKLFYDYTAGASGSAILFENNEDPSEDGTKGDYPTFLIPNTTYYVQMFTSHLEDNNDIDADIWGDSTGLAADLNSRISYKSPIISFTTWPLTELPVPMPELVLAIEPKNNVDPNGNISFTGISVRYNRVLTDVEWLRYTNAVLNRAINYEIYLSRDPSNFGSAPLAVDTAPYPEDAEVAQRGVTITKDSLNQPILPNTVYYIKARSSLLVGGDVIGRSTDTAVIAITTPKIDNGGLDNAARDPRSPSEFSIALDKEGKPILGDASVTFNWLHAEKDVIYEMVCTSKSISPLALPEEYENDAFNMGFLNAYSAFRNPANDSKISINVKSAALQAIGLLYNEQNGRVVLPIDKNYLRPNRTYFFSLRAIRNKGLIDPTGKSIEKVSRWITIPVTTKMVKAPGFIEAVKDLEIGFNLQCSTLGTTSDSMEVYIKKFGAADSQYVKLNRGQFTSVKSGNTFYFRIYNLESNQWYDIRVKNKLDGRWYDRVTGSWTTNPVNSVQEKTRDAFNEIEVRFEGEPPYEYFLEVRSDNDADYEKLTYRSSGFSDYGYDLSSGGRIAFYREKTALYVEEGSPKYVYYAKIMGKPVKEADGSVTDLPLRSNTNYYIKVWAYNLDESLHIGPANARTDFSQDDYDKEQKKDDVIDMFNAEADGLSQKLYWRIDIKAGTTVRALIKDDMVSGLLKAARESTVTVDISDEQANTALYEILVPYKTLETIEITNSSLNLKLLGAEITLNKGSIDLSTLKTQALSGDAKEAMLLLRVERKQNPKTVLPSGITAISKIYNLQASAIGSRLTYSEINGMIYNILKKSDTIGPFKYGILDRELSLVLKNLDSYSYKSHTDLKDYIKDVMLKVETELSKYLKDIIDGGSGLSPDFKVVKAITSFPGRIGIKLEYTYRNSYITPYVNYSSTWKEPAGAKAYVMQFVLFRVEKPGEYTVVGSGAVTIPGGSGNDSALAKLSAQYDLSKVFGKGTVYTANPIKGDQALMLYAVVTKRDDELLGLTPVQKASKLGIGDIMSAKQLSGYMDNQSSLSLAVKLYCFKANIDPKLTKPSKTIAISNSSQINSRLYPYVLLGIDLNLTTLDNKKFYATNRTTTGMMLDMVSKALEKFE